MKSFLPLVSSVLLLTSCTAYKSGQTPDDVYFSPERPRQEYVTQEEEKEEVTERNNFESEDDRYVRMKVRNRARWSEFEDYYRDPYAYSYKGCYCKCDYNPRLYWSEYYNPYYRPVAVYNPKAPVVNRPRTYNLHVFDNPQNNNYNPKAPGTQSRQYSTPAPRTNTSSNTGSTLRNIFGSSGSSSSSSTSTNSSSSSSSSSSAPKSEPKSGSSSAPVRKF